VETKYTEFLPECEILSFLQLRYHIQHFSLAAASNMTAPLSLSQLISVDGTAYKSYTEITA
jgi:hypothetical protein